MTTLSRRTSRMAIGAGIAGSALLLAAGPAAADTSQASATAASVKIGTASALTTGAVVATNAGPGGAGQVKTGASTSTVLAGQTLLTAGVLAQDASATNVNDSGGNIGLSAACAGAVGQGGSLQVGPSGGCLPTLGAPSGLTINLSPGIATLGADAVFAQCTASSKGAPTGSTTLANANVFLLAGLPIALAGAPAPNQGVTVPGIATIILNEQIPLAGGGLTVNALHISLLANVLTGQPVVDIIVGSVTCGPNAIAPDVSIFSGPALPAAATGAAVVGLAYIVRRRRQPAA